MSPRLLALFFGPGAMSDLRSAMVQSRTIGRQCTIGGAAQTKCTMPPWGLAFPNRVHRSKPHFLPCAPAACAMHAAAPAIPGTRGRTKETAPRVGEELEAGMWGGLSFIMPERSDTGPQERLATPSLVPGGAVKSRPLLMSCLDRPPSRVFFP